MALYDKGYIYKDHYIVNWCPRCGTAISDLEVEYVEERPATCTTCAIRSTVAAR